MSAFATSLVSESWIIDTDSAKCFNSPRSSLRSCRAWSIKSMLHASIKVEAMSVASQVSGCKIPLSEMVSTFAPPSFTLFGTCNGIRYFLAISFRSSEDENADKILVYFVLLAILRAIPILFSTRCVPIASSLRVRGPKRSEIPNARQECIILLMKLGSAMVTAWQPEQNLCLIPGVFAASNWHSSNRRLKHWYANLAKKNRVEFWRFVL